MYSILINEVSLQKIREYRDLILKKQQKPGLYLKRQIDSLLAQNSSLEEIGVEGFIDLILATKKPTIFAEREVKGDGSDWNRSELQILGDINVAIPVTVYDNGIWAPSDPKFQVHSTPFKAELLFTPGTLLHKSAFSTGNTPDFEEVVVGNQIDQNKFKLLIERRLTPILKHIHEQAKHDNFPAIVTIPGIGCGAFAGKFRGKVGEHLNKALQDIMTQNIHHYPNINCIYYNPFDECKLESKTIGNVQYRVRPENHGGKSQLCHPQEYQENGDDFSKYKLFKIVAWDHVSFPGNDYFRGSRNTDDGMSAAATNSMEVITGINGRYEKGYYLPPEGKINWKQVVTENKMTFKSNNNVKIVTVDGSYLTLDEYLQSNKNLELRKNTEKGQDTKFSNIKGLQEVAKNLNNSDKKLAQSNVDKYTVQKKPPTNVGR